MSKTTWDALSAEGKKTWDLMSDTDKKNILQHAMKRVENEQVTANNVEIAPDEEDESGTAEEEGSLETANELEINNATTDAKKQAHPGDLRRMMSNKGKGGKKKGSASKEGTVTMVVFSSLTETTIEASALETGHIDDVIKDYWDRDDDPDAADTDF
jgi:flagellar hook assembly protein FlgD